MAAPYFDCLRLLFDSAAINCIIREYVAISKHCKLHRLNLTSLGPSFDWKYGYVKTVIDRTRAARLSEKIVDDKCSVLVPFVFEWFQAKPDIFI